MENPLGKIRTTLRAITAATEHGLIVSFSDGDGVLKLLVESVPTLGRNAAFSESHFLPIDIVDSADYEAVLVGLIDQASEAIVKRLTAYDALLKMAPGTATQFGIFGSSNP